MLSFKDLEIAHTRVRNSIQMYYCLISVNYIQLIRMVSCWAIDTLQAFLFSVKNGKSVS